MVRKSRKEKEAEAAEAKRREEEEDNARAYAEFIDTFEGGATKAPSAAAFVKAGQHPPTGTSRQGPTRAFNRVRFTCLCIRLVFTFYLRSLRLPRRQFLERKVDALWTHSWRRLKGVYQNPSLLAVNSLPIENKLYAKLNMPGKVRFVHPKSRP